MSKSQSTVSPGQSVPKALQPGQRPAPAVPPRSDIEVILADAKQWMELVVMIESRPGYDGLTHDLVLAFLVKREQVRQALKRCGFADMETGWVVPWGIEGVAFDALFSVMKLCYPDCPETDVREVQPEDGKEVGLPTCDPACPETDEPGTLDRSIRQLELYLAHEASSEGNPVGQQHPRRTSERPRWDAKNRKLWLGPVLCRDFSKKQAPEQERILAAFEAAGWPEGIPAPEPLGLKATLRNLNNGLGGSPLRFHGNGTGNGILWGRE